MSKKSKLLLMTALAFITLAACGTTDTNSGKNSSTSSNESTSSSTKESSLMIEGSAPETAIKSDKIKFKKDKLTVDESSIQLTGYEVVAPDKEAGQLNPTLVILFTLTNEGQQPISPSTVFPTYFEASQKIKGNVTFLNNGMLPQTKKFEELNNAFIGVAEPGKSIDAAVSYELVDTKAPIVLTAFYGELREKLGKKEYKIDDAKELKGVKINEN